MKFIIQVLGPTGVGKSKVAIRLAQRLGGEIISADSMQVYKDFNIGTAKLSIADREEIPHHLIDVFSDCRQFNASLFLEQSFTISEAILNRGKFPIVCGGTALYLKTMIKGIFPETQERRITRARLTRVSERVGLERMWNKLHTIDPVYAQKISKNDKVRVIRAMEIFYNNGSTPSEIFRETISPFKDYRFIRIGLNLDREILYERINRRVDDMIRMGLLEEVKRLRHIYPTTCPPFKSLGYKELLMYLEGHIQGLEEAVALAKQNSRNFAKRQLSWFRQETDIRWFTPSCYNEIEAWVLSQFNSP